jgi:hypothetical protein
MPNYLVHDGYTPQEPPRPFIAVQPLGWRRRSADGCPIVRSGAVDRHRETDGEEGHDWQGTTVLLLTTTGRKLRCQPDYAADLPTARRQLPTGRESGTVAFRCSVTAARCWPGGPD